MNVLFKRVRSGYLSQDRVLGSEVSPLLPYPAGYGVAKFLPEASYLPFGPPSLVPPSCFISHTGEQSSQLTPCLFESPAGRTQGRGWPQSETELKFKGDAGDPRGPWPAPHTRNCPGASLKGGKGFRCGRGSPKSYELSFSGWGWHHRAYPNSLVSY